MNVLFKKYSTMTQEKVFSDTFSTTALAVYDEFESAEALAYMDLQELTAFIMEKGKNRFPYPDAVAKNIQKATRSSYRLPKTVNDSVNQVLSISITSIKAFNLCSNETLAKRIDFHSWYRTCILSCKMRQGVQSFLSPKVQRGEQISTQTCTRINCS